MGVTDLYTQHRRSLLSCYLCLVAVTRLLRMSARVHQGYIHSVRAQNGNTYDEAGRPTKTHPVGCYSSDTITYGSHLPTSLTG